MDVLTIVLSAITGVITSVVVFSIATMIGLRLGLVNFGFVVYVLSKLFKEEGRR